MHTGLKFFAANFEESSISYGKFVLFADSAASKREFAHGDSKT